MYSARSEIVQCAICDMLWGLFVVINWNIYNTQTHWMDSVLISFFFSFFFRQISDNYNIVAEWTEATKTHYRLPSSPIILNRFAHFCCTPCAACVWHLSYANDMYNLHLLHRLFLITPLKMHILIDTYTSIKHREIQLHTWLWNWRFNRSVSLFHWNETHHCNINPAVNINFNS